SRRRHTRFSRDWSSDVCSSDLEDLDEFTGQISELNGHVDYIIFDTGAGLSEETLKFILAAEETIVITTPEPTAITDAYAVIKMRSEERRVGKERRSGRSPSPSR